ncbi:bifunctional diguanylate cyclase/phosphodiesterase [Anoxynatronum sibiricum]|uniref:EAL domain-containing protein n=1 Tax=Anoxynatronum sibiricum TaxID=210623 RepID=A0ABU9VSM0_9CLOT
MRSIKIKILFLSLTIILAASAILGASSYQANTHVLEREAEASLELLALESAEKLSLMIQLQLKGLEELAARERVRSMDWTRQMDALLPELERQGFLALAVVNSDGIAHYIDGYTLPLGDRPYIQQALAGQTTVSEVLVSRVTGQPVVMLATPIETSDKSPAALIARMDGTWLTDLVAQIQYRDNGVACLINYEGTILAHRQHPEWALTLATLDTIREESPHFESFTSFVSQTLQTQQPGIGSYAANATQMHMGFAPVAGTDWMLYVGATHTSIMAGIAAFHEQFFTTLLLVMLGGILASLLLARHFSHPIIELERLFTQASAGDLTVRATPHTRDEIGRAGHTFNVMMDRLADLTYYDPVTGLANQRVLHQDFRELTEPFKDEENVPLLPLLLVAADNFKRINERFGYREGNQLLRMAGHRLQIYSGDHCRLYRGQSDEFILICHSYQGLAEAEKAAYVLLQKLQEPYELASEKVSITFSAGLATFPLQGETLDELLKNAGFAKNLAKEKGSGRLQVFDIAIQQQVLSSRIFEEEMSLALDRKEFLLEYQPLVDLKTGNIHTVEALIRWQHPVKGRLAPDLFIPAAENTGLINRLGKWALLEACRQNRQWMDQGLRPVVMAVNISARQFESPDFVSYVRQALNESGLPPALLELEVTESAVIQQVEENIIRLNTLRSMGIRISLDDFGTGYSSLSYVVRLPIDTLKIDRSFVSILTSSRQAHTVVSTIISMGHSLGLTLVAEGIETLQQLAMVQEASCQLGQGYHFSPPLPAAKMEMLLRQGTLKPKLS